MYYATLLLKSQRNKAQNNLKCCDLLLYKEDSRANSENDDTQFELQRRFLLS